MLYLEKMVISKFPFWFMVHCPVSFFLVQRMSLGGKWCANMINRGCRPGCGCVTWVLFNAVNPRLLEGVRDSASTEWKVGGGLFLHRVSLGRRRRWEGEGCCSRDHQSWRIIIAKNKGMVFSTLSDEFLWVSFYRFFFFFSKRESSFMKYAAIVH